MDAVAKSRTRVGKRRHLSLQKACRRPPRLWLHTHRSSGPAQARQRRRAAPCSGPRPAAAPRPPARSPWCARPRSRGLQAGQVERRWHGGAGTQSTREGVWGRQEAVGGSENGLSSVAGAQRADLPPCLPSPPRLQPHLPLPCCRRGSSSCPRPPARRRCAGQPLGPAPPCASAPAAAGEQHAGRQAVGLSTKGAEETRLWCARRQVG